MAENKGQTIFLSVIGIATLLVAIIGATFAFFSTTMINGTNEITVGTALVSNVTLSNSMTGISDILPGYESSAFTIEAVADINSGSTVTIPYTCVIKQSNAALVDLQYYVTAGTGQASSHNQTWTGITTTDAVFLTGTLTADDHDQSATLKYRFHETGLDQTDAQSNKSTNVTVTCTVDGTNNVRYYTNGAASGTATTPASQN